MNIDNNILLFLLSLLSAGLIAYFFYFYKYTKKEVNNWIRAILAFFRFLSIFSILLLLINPKFEFNDSKENNKKLVFFIDQSESLEGYKEQISSFVDKANQKYQEDLDIECYTFGSEARFFNGKKDSLKFEENRTNFQNLNYFIDKNIPVTQEDLGILVSDGIVNEGSFSGLKSWKGKMNSLIIGDTNNVSDIAITDLIVPKSIQKGNGFNIKYYVKSLNYNAPQNPIVQLYQADSLISEQKLNIRSNETKSGSFTYNSSLNKSASFTLKLKQINSKANDNLWNDLKSFYVSVLDKKIKVAILAKGVHPDIKSIKNAFKSIKEFEFKVFYEKDFKAFKVFMDSADLCIYHNVEVVNQQKPFWQITSTPQILASKEVKTNTFEDRTKAKLNQDFSVFYLSQNQKENIQHFIPLNTILIEKHNVKKSNIILTQKIGQINTELPLLFFNQEQNQAYSLSDNIWQWKMNEVQKTGASISYDALIYNIIKSLSEKKKVKRFDWESKTSFNINESIKIQFRYLDLLSKPIKNQEIELKVYDEQNKEVYEQVAIENGASYNVGIPQLKKGVYFLKVINKSGENRIFNFTIEEDLLELANLNANKAYLTEIAQKHQGQSFYLDQFEVLDQQLEELANKPKTIEIIKKYEPLISWEYLMVLIALFLGAEWLIRKFYHRI